MEDAYSSDPIQEAVCEFRFTPGLEWNSTFFGVFFERIRRDYPRAEDAVEVRGRAPSEVEAHQFSINAVRAVQFTDSDGSGMVKLAPNLLSVSVLRPYPGWPAFREAATGALEAYREAFNPKGILRIGLRYINQILIPSGTVDLEEYFEFYAFVGDRLPQVHGMFNVMVEFPYEDEADLLRLVLRGVLNGDPNSMTVLLDLDYFRPTSESLTFEDLGQWLETGHSNLKTTFEGAITDRARSLFNRRSV